MPLRPVGGKLVMPLETAADVQRLFDVGVALDKGALSDFAYMQYQRDLGDHLFYLGAIAPERFAPLQETIVMLPEEQLQHFAYCGLETWLYFLRGAPDSCVEDLLQRLSETSKSASILQDMLAAIGTPTALQALAGYARASDKATELANMGFWIPPKTGPAVPRFTLERRAAQLQPFDGPLEDLLGLPHPVGLPLTAVMHDPDQQVVTWHYCSFTVGSIAGLPPVNATRLHLVSPPLFDVWTVHSALDTDGRYTQPTLSPDTEVDQPEMEDLREMAITRQEVGRGQLILLPFDDELIYCNGHVELTPGVKGTVGGPPIGLYPNPFCPSCGKLMFHITTLRDGVRQYGDGFRSLFVCEECERVASHGTGWN